MEHPTTTRAGGNENERTESSTAGIEVVTACRHGIEHDFDGVLLRTRRQETDGGVRLAGGRLGEAPIDDQHDASDSEGSTLPPAYSSDYGDT